VGIGGLVGSVIRYGVSVLVSLTGLNLERFPVPTLTVNLIGAFLIGIFNENLSKNGKWYYVLCPGLCGGLTTFSTFCFEVQTMIRDGFAFETGVYVVVTLVAVIVLVFLGSRVHLGRQPPPQMMTGMTSEPDLAGLAGAPEYKILS
jgi:CrcB protein